MIFEDLHSENIVFNNNIMKKLILIITF